jgi:hypothetical protein
MLQRFPYLLRTGKKLLEIAGAGCASALVAFLLGNSHEQPTSAAGATNAPAVVRLAPADEEMIRSVRQENASLVAHLRTGTQAASAPTGTAAAATIPAGAAVAPTNAKTAKTLPPTQARREAKATRAAVPETKPRAPEPAPAASAIQAPVAPTARPQVTANIEVEPRVAQASTSQADSAQVLFKPISTWFSDVPRPPVGIGEDPSRSM